MTMIPVMSACLRRGRLRLLSVASAVLFGLCSLGVATEEMPAVPQQFKAPPPPSEEARRRESVLKLAVATHPENAATWADLGWRLYKNEKYAECDVVMAHARDLAPDDPYIRWLSGLAAFAIGRPTDAADYLWPLYRDYRVPVLTAKLPPYFDVAVNVISSDRGEANLDDAFPPLPALPSIIDAAMLYDVLGRSLLSRGELASACAVLRDACELNERDWHPFFFLGYAECLRAKADPSYYVLAAEVLDEARKLAPREPLVLRFLAYARSMSLDELSTGSELSSAADAARRAIAARPREVVNYQTLARVRLAQSNPDDAVKVARQALALDGEDAFSLYLLAKALVAAGGDHAAEEAKPLLVRSIALRPDLIDGAQAAPHAALLVSILLEAGDVEAAETLTHWLLQRGIGQ